MHPRDRLLLILAGLSLPLALLLIDCHRATEPQEPLPDGEVTSRQLLAAFRQDPDRARRHWSGRPVRVVASAYAGVQQDTKGSFLMNPVREETCVFRLADEKEFSFLPLRPGSTMVVEGPLGAFDGRALTLKDVRLVRR
jgi:hypothetical protein